METLQLKELAPSLPFKLMLQVDSIYEGFTCKLVTINMSNTFVNGMTINNALHYGAKPILYPLDYLTKPISHNGETFVPCDELEYVVSESIVSYVKNRLEIVEYWRVQKLFEWRFDVFNLINRGLAIPITETFNPYK